LYGQQQPVPYSHKTHLALGLKCNSCHRNTDPGELMGFPAESFCMSCHQKVRIYRLPTYVYFSHRVHTEAGATCETCHGRVRERDVITKEVSHDMRSCMACHAATKARNDCTTCHEER
jgi:hypothetical protein